MAATPSVSIRFVGCNHKQWGAGDSNPSAGPNPRLTLLIDAARRGATVRLLLDSFFADEDGLRSNRAMAGYLHTLAQAEGLDLEVRLGNPTSGGIHAKLYLIRVGSETWAASMAARSATDSTGR
jgi:cardiolipin synthase A/B